MAELIIGLSGARSATDRHARSYPLQFRNRGTDMTVEASASPLSGSIARARFAAASARACNAWRWTGGAMLACLR